MHSTQKIHMLLVYAKCFSSVRISQNEFVKYSGTFNRLHNIWIIFFRSVEIFLLEKKEYSIRNCKVSVWNLWKPDFQNKIQRIAVTTTIQLLQVQWAQPWRSIFSSTAGLLPGSFEYYQKCDVRKLSTFHRSLYLYQQNKRSIECQFAQFKRIGMEECTNKAHSSFYRQQN